MVAFAQWFMKSAISAGISCEVFMWEGAQKKMCLILQARVRLGGVLDRLVLL